MSDNSTNLTIEEIIELKGQILPGARKNKEKWTLAFEEYNEDHRPARPLQMTCRVCYPKVLHYLIQKHRND